MKPISILILLLVTALSFGRDDTESSWLFGTWEGKDDVENHGSLTLNPDGSAVFIVKGERIEDSFSEPNARLVWNYDPKPEPDHLDVNLISEDEIIFYSPFIIKRKSTDEIVLRILNDNTRPVDWNGTIKDTIVLKRKSD